MTQSDALDILKSGRNIFLTGEPGTGKTHTLNAYVTYLREYGVEVAVTASTGIAATHVGGMTIHAWSGIGIKDALSPYDIEQIAGRERTAKRMMRTKVLVIDEVSMLDARVLEMVDDVLRAVRQNRAPFGGVQVVLVGDFFQLPPIGKSGQVQFAFESSRWHELGLSVCYLHEQFRQDDDLLGSLLAAIRTGRVDESVYDVLQSCSETQFVDGIEPTRLYTHNADVDRINAERLAALSGDARTFQMEGRGARAVVDGLKKSCLSPEQLELKVGAMVMCTKNNFEAGYVNGTLGQIIGYEEKTGYPIVQTSEGEITITPASWQVSEGNAVIAEVTQVPLRLAWAITVHKSQGMSLDAAEIDLGNAFEYGQGYVALSRVRSLSGLLLRSCNERALEVHPSVRRHDIAFKKQSADVRAWRARTQEQERADMHSAFILKCGGTLTKQPIEQRAPAQKKDGASTYEKTRLLIVSGKTPAEAARARGMSLSTICGHLEQLAHDGRLSLAEMRHLLPKAGSAKKRHEAIAHAIDVVGDEKLKPIYQHLKGVHSYDDIRLARCIHLLARDS